MAIHVGSGKDFHENADLIRLGLETSANPDLLDEPLDAATSEQTTEQNGSSVRKN